VPAPPRRMSSRIESVPVGSGFPADRTASDQARAGHGPWSNRSESGINTPDSEHAAPSRVRGALDQPWISRDGLAHQLGSVLRSIGARLESMAPSEVRVGPKNSLGPSKR